MYAIPLLAGLAITHAFIPPTPGPIAVADILNADLGWVILVGFIVGVPTAVVSGPVFGKFIASKIFVTAPGSVEKDTFRSWSMMTLILASCGLTMVLFLSLFL